MPACKELYDIRQRYSRLKKQLDDLNNICNLRCTRAVRNQIEETIGEMEHLNIRRHILEMISKKFVFEL